MNQNQEINYDNLRIEQLGQRHRGIEYIGLSGSERAYLTAKLYTEHRIAMLAILPTVKEAERFLNTYKTGESDTEREYRRDV